jgi:hypothetical protein
LNQTVRNSHAESNFEAIAARRKIKRRDAAWKPGFELAILELKEIRDRMRMGNGTILLILWSAKWTDSLQ